MLSAQIHRGPDDQGSWCHAEMDVALASNRLSILDLSAAGHQPMRSADGRFVLVYNGEIYNYLELRAELKGEAFVSGTDSEVVLAAWRRWGERCLERFVGMFAFALWDEEERRLHLVRDRFGVKPLFWSSPAKDRKGGIVFASELNGLFAAGVQAVPNASTWSTYFRYAVYDHDEHSFWEGIQRLPAGGHLSWSADNGVEVRQWYQVGGAVRSLGIDRRSDGEVGRELADLLRESVRLRLRSDREVGLCLSGGFDSALLLGLLDEASGGDLNLRSYTFISGDPRYDESPWVDSLLDGRGLRHRYTYLDPSQVVTWSPRIERQQREPWGGLPTIGMAGVFRAASEDGVRVLLDGIGLDEAWAGYDYYQLAGSTPTPSVGPVQGAKSPSTLPGCLRPDFADLAREFRPKTILGEPLADLQIRDLTATKIPRSTRFSDRVSMMFSCELREPFLDHRLVELGLRQPRERKIRECVGKWLPRQVSVPLIPDNVRQAPKRPVQTPQREWLRRELSPWADDLIETALSTWGATWLHPDSVREAWREFRGGHGDNSFPVWQWISLGMAKKAAGDR